MIQSFARSRGAVMRAVAPGATGGLPASAIREHTGGQAASGTLQAMRAVAAGWASLLVVGCATPPKMQLSPRPPETADAVAWWFIRHPADLRPPIVGIERRVSSTACRQTVFCDRGVRWFDYHGGRLRHSSPPLPGAIAEADGGVSRAVLRRLCAEASCAIPKAEIAAIRSPDDLVRALQRHCRDAEVASPIGMGYRRIDAELEHFPHGGMELKEASKPF